MHSAARVENGTIIILEKHHCAVLATSIYRLQPDLQEKKTIRVITHSPIHVYLVLHPINTTWRFCNRTPLHLENTSP